MKNYLKPYTMCTRVECEGHFLKCTKYPPCPPNTPTPGGSHNGFTPGTPGGGLGGATPGTNTSSAKGFFFESEE